MFEDLDEKLQKDPELRKHYQQEKLILDVTELITKQMKKNKVNKTQLANLLGVGNSYVTQLLDGTSNMTLRTISDVFTALDSELKALKIATNYVKGKNRSRTYIGKLYDIEQGLKGK